MKKKQQLLKLGRIGTLSSLIKAVKLANCLCACHNGYPIHEPENCLCNGNIK